MPNKPFEFTVDHEAFRITVSEKLWTDGLSAHFSMTFQSIRMKPETEPAITIGMDKPTVSDIALLIESAWPNAQRLGLNIFQAATLLAYRWPT